MAARLGELDDGVEHRLELLMAEHHGAKHDVLVKLLGLRFHHQHGVRRARDHEIERRLGHLVDHRVEHILAVDIADARGTDRPQEGNAGKGQRGGGGNQGQDVGIVFHVVRQHGGDDLRLVLEALGEQRTDRPVDQARGEGVLLGRTSLALEEAAGDLTRGEGLLLVVHGQREEVDADPLLLGGDDGGENGCLAIGGQHGAVGLAGDPASLQRQGAAAPFDFYGVFIKHVHVPLCGER